MIWLKQRTPLKVIIVAERLKIEPPTLYLPVLLSIQNMVVKCSGHSSVLEREPRITHIKRYVVDWSRYYCIGRYASELNKGF